MFTKQKVVILFCPMYVWLSCLLLVLSKCRVLLDIQAKSYTFLRSTQSTRVRSLPVRHIYNLQGSRVLNGVHSLKVPAIRSVLEYLKCVLFFLVYFVLKLRVHSFLILFVLFVIAIELNERDCLNIWEIMFMVYSLGFSLEKFAAMQEHGIKGKPLMPPRLAFLS